MSKNTAILDGSHVVRRDHLRRQAEGPDAIAHLVPTEDGAEVARRRLVEAVASIGARNRATAIRAAMRRARAGGKA